MSQKETIKKVLRYVGRYRTRVIASLILAAATVVLTLYIPILIGEAVDLIISKGLVDFPGILSIIRKIAVVMLITAATQWIMNTCNNYITYHVVKDIREDAFHKLTILPLNYLDTRSHGDVVSRVIADVDTFADGLLMGFTQLFTGVVTILGTLLFMLSTNVPITLVVVCITPISFLVASYIAKKSYIMFQKQSVTRGEQTAFVEEMLGNQKIVKTFSREEAVKEQFSSMNERLGKYSLKAIFFSSITFPTTRFINGLVYAGVGIVGAFTVIRGGISIGQLTYLLSYANQYTKPFNEISAVITELQNAIVCAARIFELMEEEPQIPDKEDAQVLVRAKGEISLKEVSFRYTPEKKLLENLNLQVLPGERVAIVGPTGSGKTTLINLLMRFYDVNTGSIYVDGNDIRRITRGSLRTSFGMVLQETWLRSGTIGDNIRMGHTGFSEEQVITAAKAAHAHSFIQRLPDGYDTVITEEGGSLSQGEKQLLCIARVMLCLPPMLILDEATSSIDTRTEHKIQRAFTRMMEGRTSFIVAHRLSTIREADTILVMKDGNIVEQGNHDSLIRQRGAYAELYHSQF